MMSGAGTTRLFVGGLSQELPEEELNQKLSNFGTVKKLEIKEKKDLCTGEVLKRFAFATLDSTHLRIDQCIHSLHGKSLHGSELTIERAQESFIDRLNREREARAQGKTIDNNSNNNSQQNNQHDSYQFNFGGSDVVNTRNSSNEENHSWQRPSQAAREDTPRFGGQKRGRGWEEEEEDKHRVPEELFSSSVWREDGEDRRGGQDDHRAHQFDDMRGEEDSQYRPTSPPPQKWAKMAPRYDPKKKNNSIAANSATTSTAATTEARQPEQKLQQQPKPVLVPTTVSADLAFTGASQGFSLLSMLEQSDSVTVVAKDASEATDTATDQRDETQVLHDPEREDVKPYQEPLVPVTEKKQKQQQQPIAVKTYIKKSKFFVDLDDPEVEENLRWVYNKIPAAKVAQFSADRPEIVKLYTDWHRKAHIHQRRPTLCSGDVVTSDKNPSWAIHGEFENEGEEAVIAAAYDHDAIGPKPVALATDTSTGAVQTVRPAEEESEERDDGSWRGGRSRRGKGRGRRSASSSHRGRGKLNKTQGKKSRGSCPG